ncbi:MAG: extracellular solute-binding protein [Opitutaceae bacterium]|jgi:raffinose/stachyose/melibiose transport system substrate-binding protein|nr:extracellular solute-binding protein [Opitutaceae bacterium]
MTMRSTLRAWQPWTGVALLVAMFAWATFRFASRHIEETTGNVKVVRIAHFNLEPGMRDAVDAVARLYESRRPGVRIEQMAVPERVYTQWVRVQLLGEQPPDLIALHGSINSELLATHFSPLGAAMEAPNPWRKNEPAMEKVPWRSTFLDGVTSGPAFNASLLEVYGVPSLQVTTRLYYNRNLWREIFGHETPPASLEQFLDSCRVIQAYAGKGGHRYTPIAGSQANSNPLIDRYFAAQTQRIGLALDSRRALMTRGPDQALGFLRGEWTYDDEPVRNGLTILREVARMMTPGFTQLRRDDAVFYFVQERAAMIATGLWDAYGLRTQAAFPIGVFPVPYPEFNDARHAAGALGPVTEAGTGLTFTLGLPNAAANPKEALDFLQFLTSAEGNRILGERSGWLPGVTGTPVDPALRVFLPETDGFPRGLNYEWREVGADTRHIQGSRMHLLINETGSLESYAAALTEALPKAAMSDLRRTVTNNRRNADSCDLPIGALLRRATIPAGNTATDTLPRLAAITETQLLSLWEAAMIAGDVADLEAPSIPRPRNISQ